MNSENLCPACGSKTVSEASDGLCFTCQIRGAEAKRFSAESFFFDEGEEVAPPDADIEDRLREALDHIRIDDEIGRGAMGIVFEGVQEKLDRSVAIKVLTPHPDLSGVLHDRFMLEAKTMAKLDHPNIITIHDFGQTECNLSYFVMERINGESLLTRMQDAEGKRRELISVMAEVCDALAYAHKKDVVHRDVKPENILIDEHGRAKVADFGLAKLEGASHAKRLTRTHQMLGTPMYMAPEQVMAASSVDHRADLYAVGVMLYEILTGELPGKTVEPPSKKVTVEKGLDKVVMALLARDPEERLDDADIVAQACRFSAGNWKTGKRLPGFISKLFGN